MQITIDMPDSFIKEISGFTTLEREVKFMLASKLV